MRLGRVPGTVREGLRIVWSSGKSEFILILILQLLTVASVFVMLLAARSGLEYFLRAVGRQDPLSSLAPWVLGIAALVSLHSLLAALQIERQLVLGELVTQYLEGQVLDVATEVELLAFDDPEFHNLIQRIQQNGHLPLDVVWGITGLVEAVIGVAGVSLALISVAPTVTPVIVLLFIPAWLGSIKARAALDAVYVANDATG
ncbi:MAG: hypothetical protein ACT4OM_07765 [Actinomycetota bacterium]